MADLRGGAQRPSHADMEYVRPIPMTDPARPAGALPLAGGWCWFDRAEVLSRAAAPRIVAARDLPPEWRDRLSAPRPSFAGLSMDRPQIMGILNVTPDSFSDGGRFLAPDSALAQARANKTPIDWATYTPPAPKFIGQRVFRNQDLVELAACIDWAPFFQTWDLAGKFPEILQDEVVGAEAARVLSDGRRMLQRLIDGR